MSTSAVREMIAALADLKSSSTGAITVKPYTSSPDDRNEAVFFLKPELTSTQGVDLQAIGVAVEEALKRFDVELVATSALSGRFLDKHDIMARHYGAINRISREGVAALNPEVMDKLKDAFAVQLAGGAKILGGHQLLSISGMTAKDISDQWDKQNKGSKKLAPGTYAAELTVSGQNYIVLNGFHPYQIEYFIAPTKSIGVAVVRSPRHWTALRTDLIGSTDPDSASEGAIRKTLLANKSRFGIPQVSKGLNGVHMSAGPIEGYFEIERFFGWDRNISGNANLPAQFRKHNLKDDLLRTYEENPIVTIKGKVGSVFDLTEEKDMSEVVSQLAK